MPGGCVSGYFDGNYSVGQRATDFGIGFAAGAAGYGIGTVGGTSLTASALRIPAYGLLNVGESFVSVYSHSTLFGLEEDYGLYKGGTAFFYGMMGGAFGEAVGLGTKFTIGRLRSSGRLEYKILRSRYDRTIRTYERWARVRIKGPRVSRSEGVGFQYPEKSINMRIGNRNKLISEAHREIPQPLWSATRKINLVRTTSFLIVTTLGDTEPYQK